MTSKEIDNLLEDIKMDSRDMLIKYREFVLEFYKIKYPLVEIVFEENSLTKSKETIKQLKEFYPEEFI